MRRSNGNESGQSIVLMAFGLVVLMGIMAVAIDGGRIYTLRRDAQNAADAAALQGARALCRDEDFVAAAENVATINGFAGPGVVEINNPPVRSNSPTINSDQVEVVITATIGGGLIAPVVYQGELTTRVLAVGDCLRGSLSGSGSAIFAGGATCSTKEISMAGSSMTVVGGIHSNGDIQYSGGGQGNMITGTISYGGSPPDINPTNTTIFPATGNPVATSNNKPYPINMKYTDFRPGGWAYEAVNAVDPNLYHYYDQGDITKSVLESQGWVTSGIMQRGVYVTPAGFKFSGAGGNGLYGDGVTFVSLGDIDFSGNNTYLRPYFSGLLMFTESGSASCSQSPMINLSGSSISWGGIIFAPNGRVKMSFSSNSTMYGSIIAETVDIHGSNSMIIYDPAFLPPDPDTIELGE